ncbi:GGDEF domain-containing protein [Holophaga foetida]|uniref:GGDEF domain-containing protein n=1 Tax=Holophaga foetida TaxID=35839 RepID=UPI0002475383|nr:GGDEF domain-containing protein [Holophaga foetida]
MFHPILKRQLRKLGLTPEEAPDPEKWIQFLERIDKSYIGSDLDRYTLERSLRLSSEEMRELTHRLQAALEHLRKLSMTDELTGLMNRRFLNVAIREEVAKAIRNHRNIHRGHPERVTSNVDIAFVMVDIDHFKHVNDTYGHRAGDQVIIQVCQLLAGACRDTDSVIRWGGEEFLIVARDLDTSGLGPLCERIRRSVAEHPFQIGQRDPLSVTCSIGAAVFPFLGSAPNALTWERVVDLADTCLYAAKRSGRDAWVRIGSTELTSAQDLTPTMNRAVPVLIQAGRLEVETCLPETRTLHWRE